MHYNFIQMVLNSYRTKKNVPLYWILKNSFSKKCDKISWNICQKKAISEYTKNIILYSAKSSEEIEIDEHFVSYYSEEGELFFFNMEYLHQKCFYFLES